MKQFTFQLNEERFKEICKSLNKKQFIALSNCILLQQQLIQVNENVILELRVQLYEKQKSKKIKVQCSMAYMPNRTQVQIQKSTIQNILDQFQEKSIQYETLLTMLQQYSSEDESCDLSTLIEHIEKYFDNQFTRQSQKMLNPMKQIKNNFYLVYSYTLEFDKDAITNAALQNPFLLFENDSLLIPLQFQDQQTYFRSIFENKLKINSEKFEENVPILMIFQLYQQLNRMNYQTKIYIYPKLGNYAVFIDDKQYFYNEDHQMQFFFRNQRQEFNQFSNLINLKQFGTIELFEVSQDQLQGSQLMININSDLTNRITYNQITKLWNIDKYVSDIDINYEDLDQQILQQLIFEYQEKLRTYFVNQQDSQIWISKKPYQYIFSTECYDITTPFRHQLDIQYDLLDNNKGRVIKQIVCKDCGNIIIDYSTVFVEKKLYKFYQKTQKLFQQQYHNLHPYLFLFPLALEKLEMKNKKNTWWKLILQLNNQPLINYYYLYDLNDYNEDIGIEMQYQRNEVNQYQLADDDDDRRFTLEGSIENSNGEPLNQQQRMNK